MVFDHDFTFDVRPKTLYFKNKHKNNDINILSGKTFNYIFSVESSTPQLLLIAQF